MREWGVRDREFDALRDGAAVRFGVRSRVLLHLREHAVLDEFPRGDGAERDVRGAAGASVGAVDRRDDGESVRGGESVGRAESLHDHGEESGGSDDDGNRAERCVPGVRGDGGRGGSRCGSERGAPVQCVVHRRTDDYVSSEREGGGGVERSAGIVHGACRTVLYGTLGDSCAGRLVFVVPALRYLLLQAEGSTATAYSPS